MNQASLQTLNAIVASSECNERGRNASDVYSALHVWTFIRLLQQMLQMLQMLQCLLGLLGLMCGLLLLLLLCGLLQTCNILYSAFAAPVRIHHCVVDDPVLIEEDQSEGWAQSTAAHTFHADHHSDKRSTTQQHQGRCHCGYCGDAAAVPFIVRASQADLYRVLMARSLLTCLQSRVSPIWAKDFTVLKSESPIASSHWMAPQPHAHFVTIVFVTCPDVLRPLIINCWREMAIFTPGFYQYMSHALASRRRNPDALPAVGVLLDIGSRAGVLWRTIIIGSLDRT
ncbi:hypothetical protein BASA60_010004 [Batrachochytrium salamandrivorans]|nr:hypothetical protein BASA60_010004 [Batrachochytrium salamandrivorans]